MHVVVLFYFTFVIFCVNCDDICECLCEMG